jgi:hypothetical protein
MKTKSNGLSAAQFFREYFGESAMYDSIEIVHAAELTCARCGTFNGHLDDCAEPFLQDAMRLLNTSAERIRRERGK